MKKLLVILLSCFCLFAFSGIIMAQENNTPTEEQIIQQLFPQNMTYDGILNPKDTVDESKYQAVHIANTPNPSIQIVFLKAVNMDIKVQYVAVVFVQTQFGPKIMGFVYLDEYNVLHMIGLETASSTHYSEKPIIPANEARIRADFNRIFGLSLSKSETCALMVA